LAYGVLFILAGRAWIFKKAQVFKMPYREKAKQLRYMSDWRKRNRARCNAVRRRWMFVSRIGRFKDDRGRWIK
jgi:hypothetical protein